MSDVNPLFVIIPAILLCLVAYAVFQFLRQCRELQRRGQQTETKEGSEQKTPDRAGNDFSSRRFR